MKTSDSRILITHVGSLPRGERLTDLLIEDELHPATDRTVLTAEIERRVAFVMQKQHEAGVDIANDGEQGRVGFQTYIPQRMTGFGGEFETTRAARIHRVPVVCRPLAGAHSAHGKGVRRTPGGWPGQV